MIRTISIAFALLGCMWAGVAAAASYTGTITMLEIWRTGNVAFRIANGPRTCNGQFIVNASDPGIKNELAALLSAQRGGVPVVIYTSACVPADNYGQSYNNVYYIHINQ